MQTDLTGMLQVVGGVASIRAPYTGKALQLRSEDTSKAIMKIASTNPAVYRFLERVLYVSDWVEVGRAASSLATAAALDLGAAREGPAAPVIQTAANFLIPDVVAAVSQDRKEFEELLRQQNSDHNVIPLYSN